MENIVIALILMALSLVVFTISIFKDDIQKRYNNLLIAIGLLTCTFIFIPIKNPNADYSIDLQKDKIEVTDESTGEQYLVPPGGLDEFIELDNI